jgi:hypothetical protein
MLAIDMRFNPMPQHVGSFICVAYREAMTRDNVSYTLCAPKMVIKTRDGRMMGASGIGTDIESHGVRAGNGANTMTG